MQPGSRRDLPIFYKPDSTGDVRDEKKRLMAEIQAQKQVLSSTDYKVNHYQRQCQKMMESNERNIKRLMKHKGRLDELYKHRNEPEHFLYICGFMNEYMQEFMICHNVNVMQIGEEPNPDNMSYEQLLELGDSIGRVSKGISKEQFESLIRSNKIRSDQSCPICCTEFSIGEKGVILDCKHAYHEQCIFQWLKDENTCPICKKNVVE